MAVAAGTAIAVASSSGGATPPPAEPLATALHQAITAPAPQSVSANVTLTNHLITSSDIQGSDPLLTGASGYLWATKDRLRIQLPDSGGSGKEADLVVNNGSWWLYDPGLGSVYKGTLPAQSQSSGKDKSGQDTVPSIAQIQSELTQLLSHVNLTGPTPGATGGQPSYTVAVTPKHSGGLLGAVQLAWDAAHGLPLTFALYSSTDPQMQNPVLALTASNVTYNNVTNADFAAKPPDNVPVVKVATPASPAAGAHTAHGKAKKQQEVTGLSAVSKHLSFPLSAPDTLVGMSRQSVQLLDWGGHPAALVTYGQNLGGIAVIEQAADSSQPAPTSSSSDHHGGLSLPTISVNGATGTELNTAIGTVVRFTHNKVAFTVLGSVQHPVAEMAAQALAPKSP
jgi:hypothetical protein